MSWEIVAETRRANELRALRMRYIQAKAAADTPDVTGGALGGDYARLAEEQKAQRLKAADEIEAQIASLERLEDDKLIQCFCPEAEVKPTVDDRGVPVEFTDSLLRGASVAPRFVQV